MIVASLINTGYHDQLRRRSLRAFSILTTFGDLNQRYSPDDLLAVNRTMSASGIMS
jgi:hypothetical protein